MLVKDGRTTSFFLKENNLGCAPMIICNSTPQKTKPNHGKDTGCGQSLLRVTASKGRATRPAMCLIDFNVMSLLAAVSTTGPY